MENFSTTEYQMALEEYLAAPAGRFYSNSTDAQKEIWDSCRSIIDRFSSSSEVDRENELGDEVDWAGYAHHTGCMEAGLENILEYEELEEEDTEAVSAFLTTWRAFMAEGEA